MLRLTPRNHEGQYIVHWRIDVSADARLDAHEDAFGNVTHVFTADGPFAELRINVDGEVETQNTDGVVRGTLERFPPSLFLRDTALTHADDAIRDFALDLVPRTAVTRSPSCTRCSTACTRSSSAKPKRRSRRRSRSRGLHAQAGWRRRLDAYLSRCRPQPAIPARYVAGYRCGSIEPEGGGHAWAEAHVPRFGWVGFDTLHGVCPTDAYVRVAIGLDALGAAPVRGTRYGAAEARSAIAIRVDQ